MNQRIKHDVSFASAKFFVEPLSELLNESDLKAWQDHCYHTLVPTLEAYDRELGREERRLNPLGVRPSGN
jgi:hypothetical protein